MSHNGTLSKLKTARNLEEFADFIGIPLQSLTYVLHGIHRLGVKKYTSFPVRKKRGGERIISAPVKELKDIQRKLSDKLHDCFHEILIVNGYRTHDKKDITIAHGFIKDKSIITNAECHRNKRYVLNLDLEDFFGSIHYGRVYGFFKTNKYFCLNTSVAHALANIVCYENGLPQGAPTSPIVSNLIAHILDIRLVSLSKKYKIHYTRYADDLTFSTNEKIFPNEIALLSGNVASVGNKLERVIDKCGFKVNLTKTRLQFNDSRQEVTGLIVNKKVNVRKEYIQKTRILANKIFNGKEIYKIESNVDDKKDIAYLIGVLGFVYNVRRSQLVRTASSKTKDKVLKNFTKKDIDASLDANARLYRDAIFFKNFIDNEFPFIVCEGKTDIIYLRAALISLASKHRLLVKKDDVKLNFLNHTNTIRELFKINGGTGDLGNLISNYSSYCTRFSRFHPKNPVIIIIDNDSGANTIRSLVKSITKKTYDKNDGFRHIINNLYIMQTPIKKDGNDSAIEDLFDKKTLDIKLEDKSFSYDNNFNKAKHYSKNHFAEYVVKPKRKEIDFSGFNSLFVEIKEIIKNYRKS